MCANIPETRLNNRWPARVAASNTLCLAIPFTYTYLKNLFFHSLYQAKITTFYPHKLGKRTSFTMSTKTKLIDLDDLSLFSQVLITTNKFSRPHQKPKINTKVSVQINGKRYIQNRLMPSYLIAPIIMRIHTTPSNHALYLSISTLNTNMSAYVKYTILITTLTFMTTKPPKH
jgi:hypothetical protein